MRTGYTTFQLTKPDSIDQIGLLRHLSSVLRNSNGVVQKLADGIKERKADIESLLSNIGDICKTNDGDDFSEMGDFQDYTSFRFFYYMGDVLDNTLATSLRRLERIAEAMDSVERTSQGGGREDYLGGELDYFVTDANTLAGIKREASVVFVEGIQKFKAILAYLNQRSVDQYRYLQKRFQNIGVEESRIWRSPLEGSSSQSGFDISRVPYVKIDLIRGNALLTDLLLDAATHTPNKHTRRDRVGKKRKVKDVKYVNPFDLDRFSRIFVELSDPSYQGYLNSPRTFMGGIGTILRNYYDVMHGLEEDIKGVMLLMKDNPFEVLDTDPEEFRKEMFDPTSFVNKMQGIDYEDIRPTEEEVRPSNQREKRYFRAREELLEHLLRSMEKVMVESDEERKLSIARAAVKKATTLKERVRRSHETSQVRAKKRNEKTDNEFYVGVSGAYGEFSFEREVAPNVKMREVHGKSFDAMKAHITDLLDYSRYLHLYRATAPRGNIRSNMVVIGPYGCGKTEIARAIASDPKFVGAEINVTDAVTCFFGEFEKNVDRVWDAAQELRRNTGEKKLVFLLMDEFDSWFNSSDGHWVDHTYQRVQKTIQTKLDGIVDYEGIVVLGLTNEPSKIPMPIYRRFKYVDVVGQLEPQERTDLLRMFLSRGLPLSSGFRSGDYERWGKMLDGATGDIVGKVVDEIHYTFMRQFLAKHPKEGRRLNNEIARMERKADGRIDRAYVKRVLGRHMRVAPTDVEHALKDKLDEPIIQEQLKVAQKVYAEADKLLRGLHRRDRFLDGDDVYRGDVRIGFGTEKRSAEVP